MIITRELLKSAGYHINRIGALQSAENPDVVITANGNPIYLVENPDGWTLMASSVEEAESRAARDFMIRVAAAETQLGDWRTLGFPKEILQELEVWIESIGSK